MVRPCFHVKEGLDESRRLCRQARDSKESDAGNGERKESPTTYGVARDSGTPPLVVWPGGLSGENIFPSPLGKTDLHSPGSTPARYTELPHISSPTRASRPPRRARPRTARLGPTTRTAPGG